LLIDAESDWLYKLDEAFDFIHGRALGGSIADWARFYCQVYTHLKSGGWIEMQEYEAWVKSDDDSINQNGKSVLEGQRLVNEASIKFGKRFNVAELQKQYLIDALDSCTSSRRWQGRTRKFETRNPRPQGTLGSATP
jgi:hypothetical protein